MIPPGPRPARGRLLGAPALVLALAAAGCSSQPTLYDWSGYESSVKAALGDFRESDPAQQAQHYHEILARIETEGRRAPPGAHAHLAWLHSVAGEWAEADDELAREMALFPESATLVERLRAQLRRGAP